MDLRLERVKLLQAKRARGKESSSDDHQTRQTETRHVEGWSSGSGYKDMIGIRTHLALSLRGFADIDQVCASVPA